MHLAHTDYVSGLRVDGYGCRRLKGQIWSAPYITLSFLFLLPAASDRSVLFKFIFFFLFFFIFFSVFFFFFGGGGGVKASLADPPIFVVPYFSWDAYLARTEHVVFPCSVDPQVLQTCLKLQDVLVHDPFWNA